jgi:hypothetical protein
MTEKRTKLTFGLMAKAGSAILPPKPINEEVSSATLSVEKTPMYSYKVCVPTLVERSICHCEQSLELTHGLVAQELRAPAQVVADAGHVPKAARCPGRDARDSIGPAVPPLLDDIEVVACVLETD